MARAPRSPSPAFPKLHVTDVGGVSRQLMMEGLHERASAEQWVPLRKGYRNSTDFLYNDKPACFFRRSPKPEITRKGPSSLLITKQASSRQTEGKEPPRGNGQACTRHKGGTGSHQKTIPTFIKRVKQDLDLQRCRPTPMEKRWPFDGIPG